MRGLATAVATALVLVAATGARADEPRARLQGVTDARLQRALREAIGTIHDAPASRLDARRRATEAAERAMLVLRSEGYYQAEIEPTVSETDPPRAILTIRTGQRFLFGPSVIAWSGSTPTPEAVDAAEDAGHIEPGQPGRAIDVLSAEGRIVASLQQEGYPDAEALPREVVVNHADYTVTPTFHVASGDLVRLDGLRVVTSGHTRPGYVQALAPWRPGDIYRPGSLSELERRLQDVGVYSAATVTLAPREETGANGLRPVIVNLVDRPPHTLEVGLSYSTTEGAGLDARRTDYNRLGRFDTVTWTLKAAQIQQRLDAELALPNWRRANQRLRIGGGFYGDRTDAFNDYGAGVRIDVERRYGRASLASVGSFATAGLTLDYVSTYDKTVTNPSWQHLGIATVLGAFAWDGSDNVFDPHHGWRVEARAEPTVIVGDVALAYVKVQMQGAYYVPLGSETVVAVRARLGSVLGGRLPDVPVSRRLFAGGGGSVRGYAYQGVGPRRADNTPSGGLSLVESSVELRRHIVGPWGAAVFLDAGSVATNQAPDFSHLAAGVGVGIRYDLGFGPIRLDVAVPLNPRTSDPAFQVYISIGQAF